MGKQRKLKNAEALFDEASRLELSLNDGDIKESNRTKQTKKLSDLLYRVHLSYRTLFLNYSPNGDVAENYILSGIKAAYYQRLHGEYSTAQSILYGIKNNLAYVDQIVVSSIFRDFSVP